MLSVWFASVVHPSVDLAFAGSVPTTIVPTPQPVTIALNAATLFWNRVNVCVGLLRVRSFVPYCRMARDAPPSDPIWERRKDEVVTLLRNVYAVSVPRP